MMSPQRSKQKAGQQCRQGVHQLSLTEPFEGFSDCHALGDCFFDVVISRDKLCHQREGFTEKLGGDDDDAFNGITKDNVALESHM